MHTTEEEDPESKHVELRCEQCRIPHHGASVRELRGIGWRQQEDGTWLCPRCAHGVARAS